MNIDYTMQTDVLIIGGGAAGIKAAITASDSGAQVLLVTKQRFGHTGSTFYPGTRGWGMNAIIHPGDTVRYYIEEILAAADHTADPRLSELLATQCTDRFHELESYGINFSKDEHGNYNGVIPCFGKRVRGSTTIGLDAIRSALWKQLMIRNVTIRDQVSIISLVVEDGTCIGALAIDEMDSFAYIQAKAVLLATGGACGIYRYGLATADQTGNGYALALDAGARLVNLEFIQFIPGLTHPVKKMLFQEKNLDSIPSVTNRHGKEILNDYLPANISVAECLTERAKHGPFSNVTCSRYFDIAMYEEWRKGNVLDSGGIHMQYDASILSDTRWFITSWLEWMNAKHIDVVNDGFDMICHAQGFNGGIYIDRQCATGVRGLFAAGETAGGPHGADRLGGAAIAATQVFGAIAGKEAARWASDRSLCVMKTDEVAHRVSKQLDSKQGGIVSVAESIQEIQTIMWENGAIVRSAQRCDEGLKKIAEIEKRFNVTAHLQLKRQMKRAVDLRSAIETAKVLLTVMRHRKESRGPHYRIDYPEQDPALAGMIAVRKKETELSFEVIRW